jgi:hypothetical protein
MNESVYAPPKTDFTTKEEGVEEPGFYVVSPHKMTVLFMATLGFYQIYWNYKNWSRYKQLARRDDGPDQNIWPVPRAVFSIFFTHALFREVDAFATSRERPLQWDAAANATKLVLLLFASGISGRLSDKGIGSPYTDMVWLLLLIPMVILYRQAQRHINAACGDREARGNSDFTVANWIWIVIGGGLMALFALSLMLPEST